MVLLTNGNLAPKLEAHIEGLQHYAFSVFIFNQRGECLLQRRALHKYHSGGLWTNACCSHPTTDEVEVVKYQAEKRLEFEMGIKAELDYCFSFEYKAVCGELIENEHDFVFIGFSDAVPVINTDEVDSYKWLSLEELEISMKQDRSIYTEWFNIIMEAYSHKLTEATKREKTDAQKKVN